VRAASGNVLLVGVGGLGAPTARTLVRSADLSLLALDDDVVEASNLHRQILFDASDVGRPKLDAALETLREEAANAGRRVTLEGRAQRFLPTTALGLLRGVDVVVEGADNLATKFLVADAARLAGVAAVQAGAVRWHGWAMASLPGGPCMRCVFEDIPSDRVETCAEGGILGPVVGVLGAIQAALTLRVLAGDASVRGEIFSYDALAGTLRRSRVMKRPGCPLCEGTILDLCAERYTAPCAA
jgi:adenylyltransferase/sulfurtransferase